MSNKPLDLSKPVQTRDGRKARIICTDLKCPDFPIVAAFQLTGSFNEEVSSTFRRDGTFLSGTQTVSDLINVPEKREVWINFYPKEEGRLPRVHDTKSDADKHASKDREACVKVVYQEGDGL